MKLEFDITVNLIKSLEIDADEKLLLALIVDTADDHRRVSRGDIMFRLGWTLPKTKRTLATLKERGFTCRTPTRWNRYSLLGPSDSGAVLCAGGKRFAIPHTVASARVFDSRRSSVIKIFVSMVWAFKGTASFMATSATIARSLGLSVASWRSIADELVRDKWIECEGRSKRLTPKSVALIKHGEDANATHDADRKYVGRELRFSKMNVCKL